MTMQLTPENVRLARLAEAQSVVRELQKPPAGLEEWLRSNERRTRRPLANHGS